MVPLVAAVLGILSILVILVPFVRRSDEESLSTDNEILTVRNNRNTLYQSLDILELEFKLGHVDSRSYAEALEEYRREAAKNLRFQEALENQRTELEQEIEVEIEQFAQTFESDDLFCPECHELLDPASRTCDQCGFGGVDNPSDTTDTRSPS